MDNSQKSVNTKLTIYTMEEMKDEFIGTPDMDQRKIFDLCSNFIIESEQLLPTLKTERCKQKVKTLIKQIEELILSDYD